jgi:uracil-DNA glycosylase family 4
MSQSTLFDASLLDPTGPAAIIPIDRKQFACGKCKLAQSRTNVVLGEGNMVEPLVMFVGEGPGAQEDASGRPFVGRAGKLLDKMVVAMGLTREAIYITNVVACRPPQNRQPEPEEIMACMPFLMGRVRAVKPKAIVALGGTAAKTLIRTRKGVADLRGKWHTVGQEADGIPVRVTYHPAFLLRPQGAQCKAAAWRDLQEVMKLVGLKTEASAP